jgi:hypothetical protein
VKQLFRVFRVYQGYALAVLWWRQWSGHTRPLFLIRLTIFFFTCDTVRSVLLLAAPVLSLRHFALISWGCWSGVGGTKLHFKGSNYIVATSGVCTCKRLGENGFVVSKMGPHSARRWHTVRWYQAMNIWACNVCVLSLCLMDYACRMHWKKRQASIFVLDNL